MITPRRRGTRAERAHAPLAAVLAPEARRLLATVGRGAADPGPVDGQRLLALALEERAVWVLWNDLRPEERSGLPRRTAESFRALAAVEEFRMRALENRLEEVVDLLRERRIPVTLLKGAALARWAYESFRHRPMVDLDLLVPQPRAREARAVLLDNDWGWESDRFPDRMYDRHYHLPPLVYRRQPEAVVEIHWDVLPDGHPFGFGGDEIRRRSRPRSMVGVEVQVPDPVDHLVYICIHFSWIHALGRGAWRTFRDVDALSREPGFSWEEFVRRAWEGKAASCCYWSLVLARGVGRVDVPDDVLTALKPPGSDLGLRTLERHFAVQLMGERDGCPSVLLRKGLWTLAMRPGREGHGEARPWTHSEDFASLVDGAPMSVGDRVAWHLGHLSRWWRYVKRLTGTRGS